MSELDRQLYKREVREEVQATTGYIRLQTWTAPLAASATKILSAQSLTSGGTITSFLNQPDVARTLQYVCSSTCTGMLTVNGTDMRGTAITETVTLTSATIVHGTKAFASITSIVLPTQSGITLNVGTDTLLGLDRRLPANTIVSYTVDGATDSAAPTVASNNVIGSGNLALNTVKFATAPNGTHVYVVAFVSNEITTASQSTT